MIRLPVSRRSQFRDIAQCSPSRAYLLARFKRHPSYKVGGSWTACGRVEIKASHERYVNNPATEPSFGGGKFLYGERPQSIPLVPLANGDTERKRKSF
jgi:hypothetical protein